MSKPLCNYVGTSIHDPQTRVVCDRTATTDGRCPKHTNNVLEGARIIRKNAAFAEKKRLAYLALCQDLGDALIDDGYLIPALAPQVTAARKARKAWDKAKKKL